MGVPLPVVWQELLPEKSDELKGEMDGHFLERLIDNISEGHGALYPGVEELLEKLCSEGYSIFIASNGLVRYLEVIVSYYGLERWVKETFSIEQAATFDKGDLVRTIKEKYAMTDGAVVDRLPQGRRPRVGRRGLGRRFGTL